MKKILLETKRLTKYFGGLGAVKQVNFYTNAGEIVSLIGPNGAGKTTFFNLITGFLRPTEGRILYEGKDITRLKPHQVADLGMVRTFQKTKVFPQVSVLEGVMMGCHRKAHLSVWSAIANTNYARDLQNKVTQKAMQILQHIGIEQRAHTLAKNLPYGEQRLLEIAVAMGSDPELLLLDEPTAGMNPEETKRTMDLIYKIRDEGITVLLVEHDMSVVMGISDRIVVLDSGSKIAEGLPQKIQENEEVIKAYLGEEYISHVEDR